MRLLGRNKGRQPVPDHDDYEDMETGSASRSHLRKDDFATQMGRHTSDYAASETSDISAGPEKWRRVRRGAHVSYQPFDVEDYQDAAEEEVVPMTFPPPSETQDDRKNWPKSCPFLHLDADEFAIADKRRFIKIAYNFWHFLYLTLLWNLMSTIVANLISPSPKEVTVFVAFVSAFVGFWWFFFGHFRLLYHAMRYRKGGLYLLYQLETAVLFFLACYMIFSAMGNLTQLISPLAPGSAVPVKQNPEIATVLLGIAAALWVSVMLFCFFFIRKAHYFKNLPLSIERDIWIKENRPTAVEESSKRCSEWIRNLFREKPDKPYEPTKCGMLVGEDLWLQGMITLETVYVEFRADVHVFDHLVHERFQYQDVLAIRKTGVNFLTFQLVHPTKRQLEDLEMVFDFSDGKIRDALYKTASKLWRRVGRNVDLLARERAVKIRKMRKAGRGGEIDEDEPDMVEAFNMARRLETRERLNNHMVTYKDWQRILEAVTIHVLEEGQPLLATGGEFTAIYHVAQGRIEVSEVVDSSVTEFQEDDSLLSAGMTPDGPRMGDHREKESYARVLAKRKGPNGKKNVGHNYDEEPLEYEDPNEGPAMTPRAAEDSGSSEEADTDEDEKTATDETSEDDSDYRSDIYSLALHEAGPETVVLGTLRKDDIFGVVPFLLGKEGQTPKSGLTFTAKDPNTVIFSMDTEKLKTDILKPKKDVTAAFHKYLAVILGERTEAAEDAMFVRKVEEKRLEAARVEERLLEEQRRLEEEAGPGADKSLVDAATKVLGENSKNQAVRNMFNFSASENILEEVKGRYTYFDRNERKEVRVSGFFYITDHYFAFVGTKKVDLSHLEFNRQFRDVMRHDEVITIKRHTMTVKALVFTDIAQRRKMLEVKTEAQRERVLMECNKRWKNEGETSSREMRRTLRRKMTRLSLGYLTQAETITQKGIVSLMADMSEREKKALFAGSVPIGLNRNQVVIGELNFNDNLYLLCTGIVRVQRVKEHVSNVLDSGKAMDRVVFQEIHSGEIFGFDSFLTGAPAYSSIVVDSEKAVVRSCTKEQIVARLREDRKLAAKFYRIAAVSIASRLAEISPLDVYL